jgi:hypothetical protein
VIPAFQAQIGRGGPVYVTHPDVTRYFMTIEEAVQLVIQAGAIGRGGSTMVLDMGEPVRILDLAKRMIAESNRSISVTYSGLRPGEKLHEELYAAVEHPEPAAHPLLSSVFVPELAPEAVASLPVFGEADGVRAELERVCYLPRGEVLLDYPIDLADASGLDRPRAPVRFTQPSGVTGAPSAGTELDRAHER